jgi:hypothetical protein
MDFKEIDKDTDKRLLVILFTVIFTASSFYCIMKTDINTTDMAMYWASYGTVLQAVFAAFQAIFAGIIIIMTISLGKKQAKLAIQQNEIVKEQNEMTRRQINLALYEKRYKIRNECIGFLDDLININLPSEYEEYERKYTQEDVTKIIDHISKNNSLSNPENYFLLADDVIQKLNGANKLNLTLRSYIRANVQLTEYEKNRERLSEIQGELQNLQEQIDAAFKDMLDFKKI